MPASPSQRIVLHADDFGMNSAVNAGIVQAFDEGLLTSASLLANAPATADAIAAAAQLATRHREGTLRSRATRARLGDPALPFDFGVHVNLTQGRPLTPRYPAALLDAEGCFPSIGSLFARLLISPRRWQQAIVGELAAQVSLVCDHGLRPTHLNGHQYIELLPAIAAQLESLLGRFAIPVVRVAIEPGLWSSTRLGDVGLASRILAGVKRWYAGGFGRRMRARGVFFPTRFFGTAHAGRIDRRVLSHFLRSAAGSHLAEIAFHPACPAPQSANSEPANSEPGDRERGDRERTPATGGWSDPLAHLRPAECALLTSPALADTLLAGGFALGRLSMLAAPAASRDRAA